MPLPEPDLEHNKSRSETGFWGPAKPKKKVATSKLDNHQISNHGAPRILFLSSAPLSGAPGHCPILDVALAPSCARRRYMEDELWISSEDLNTENSSDEEKAKAKQAYKKKLKLKTRKRSSPNIKIQRPSVSSIPSTSGAVDERLLIPKPDDIHSRSDDSKTSDEEYNIPPISSECLLKRLSLEDWRPMKGSLNISSPEEVASKAGDDTRKIVNETSNFYNAMLCKLKSLKSCSVLNSARQEKSGEQEKLSDEEKTFKFLKNTPEVKQKLNFINKLDEEINEAMKKYKAEREDRLQVEFKMCRTMSKQKLIQERDSEIFLEMCNFEERLKKYKENAQNPLAMETEDGKAIQDIEAEGNDNLDDGNKVEEVIQGDEKKVQSVLHQHKDGLNNLSNNFVRRNIYGAKEGTMACFSLTDEQKTKIADLLKEIDDYKLDDAELKLSTNSLTSEKTETNESKTDKIRWDNDNFNNVNAFAVSENEKFRIGQINNELEKFQHEEEIKEKHVHVVKDDEFWKQYIMDQSLKDIDAQLEKLYASYIEDENKLRGNASNNEATDEEVVLEVKG